MPRRPTRQKDHHARYIFRGAQPLIRHLRRHLFLPAKLLHQPARHLAREKARRDAVDEDVARPQLDG